MRFRLAVLLASASLILLGCKESGDEGLLGSESQFTESGLEYVMLSEGSGNIPEFGEQVVAHCVLKIGDTAEVWNTRNGEPYSFQYAETGQIRGFIEAIGMIRQGGRMKVIIPPDLGYGPQPYGDIPANARLSFDIEVLEVNDLMLWIADSLVNRVVTRGLDSGLAFYEELKSDGSGNYELNERQLMVVGSQLRNAGRLNDSFAFIQLRVREYPQSIGAYFSLGTVFEERGETEKAIEAFEQCLELAPDNPAVISKLDGLRGVR